MSEPVTPHVALRFHELPSQPACWQLVTPSGRTFYGDGWIYSVVEDDLSPERVVRVARLLGIEVDVLRIMRDRAAALKTAAAVRLEASRAQRAEAEEFAIAERREAERLLRDADRMEAIA